MEREKKKGTILVTLKKREKALVQKKGNSMVIDDDEYKVLILIASKWEAMCELLRGEEVSDFMLSFPEVRQVSDMVGYGGIRCQNS